MQDDITKKDLFVKRRRILYIAGLVTISLIILYIWLCISIVWKGGITDYVFIAITVLLSLILVIIAILFIVYFILATDTDKRLIELYQAIK